jgi:hypothetical protein
MRKNSVSFLSVFLMLLLVSRLMGQELREPQFMEQAKPGFTDIFNLDYDKAQQVFVTLEKEYPQHPAPPLYLASIIWLKEMLRRQDLSLNRFIAASYFSKKTNEVMPPRERAAFLEDLQKSKALSDAILQKNPRDKDARYFVAMYYGLRASFAITIDHSLHDAFSNGNKAYSYSEQLIQEDPDYYDAYLTVGIYEYIVGSIPWYLKWLTFIIGAHGNKQEGLAHIGLAAEKGQYIKNEAKLVLMVLDVRDHQYAEALEIARYLHDRFPRSYLLALNVAQILRAEGNEDQAVAVLLDVEKQAEAGEPNYNELPLQTFRFNLGVELMNMDKLDLAQEQFQKSVEDPQTPDKQRALSHLRLGQILDRKGQSGQAEKECQAVLSLPDVDHSHDQAEQLLRKLQHQ